MRGKTSKELRYGIEFPAAIIAALAMAVAGLIIDGPDKTIMGLFTILTTQDLLITDYIAVAGIGAAFVNSAAVTIISACLIRNSGDPYNGFTVVELALMAGFSLFGKNFLNIWPIIFGTYLYSKYQKEPFSKYVGVALLGSSLSPLVSYLALGSIHANVLNGALAGIVVGFLMPPLSAYTYKIQNGMNLYNMGFACGLVAMMIVPILTAFGDKPDTALYWSSGNNLLFAVLLSAACLIIIFIGLFGSKSSPRAVWGEYRRLLRTTGRAPSDYFRMFGMGPTMVNIGIDGLLGMAYIILIGGDLNGPTLGGIITIMGFSAYGKHFGNCLPVMLGIAIGAFGMHHAPNYPSLQLAALFGTTLAPISGHFGWPFGIIAGFIHASLVLQTGGPVAGLNLYNNGFSGGLIAIVMYPVVTAVARHRRPVLRDEDYFDQFEENAPIDTSSITMEHEKKQIHLKNLLHPAHEMMDDTPDVSEYDGKS